MTPCVNSQEERATRVIFDRFASTRQTGIAATLSVDAFEQCLQALNFRLQPGQARKLFIKPDTESGGTGSLDFTTFVAYVFRDRED